MPNIIGTFDGEYAFLSNFYKKHRIRIFEVDNCLTQKEFS